MSARPVARHGIDTHSKALVSGDEWHDMTCMLPFIWCSSQRGTAAPPVADVQQGGQREQRVVALHDDLAGLVRPDAVVQQRRRRVVVPQRRRHVGAEARARAARHGLHEQEAAQVVARLRLAAHQVQRRLAHRGAVRVEPARPVVAAAGLQRQRAPRLKATQMVLAPSTNAF